MVHITIPLEPRTKKNSQNIFINFKTGNRFISTSDAYKEYVQKIFFLAREKDEELKFPISCPVNVHAEFFMGTRRKVDLSNLLSCLCDVMVTFGIVTDDNCNIIATHDGSKVCYCKEDPRTEIYITRVEDTSNMQPQKKRQK